MFSSPCLSSPCCYPWNMFSEPCCPPMFKHISKAQKSNMLQEQDSIALKYCMPGNECRRWNGVVLKRSIRHAIKQPGECCAFESWGLDATCKFGNSIIFTNEHKFVIYPVVWICSCNFARRLYMFILYTIFGVGIHSWNTPSWIWCIQRSLCVCFFRSVSSRTCTPK